MEKPYGIVYIITNSVNGKVYVGQTISSMARRWRQHAHYATRSLPSGMAIHHAMRKYGIDAFQIRELEQGLDRSDLDRLEIFYIAEFHATDPQFGYNLTGGGVSYVVTPEMRRAMSVSAIASMTDAKKKKISDALKGRHVTSQETLDKMSAASSGRVFSPEARLHMAQAARNRPVKLICVNGHFLTGDNIYVRPDGHRQCKTCVRDHQKAFNERKVAA